MREIINRADITANDREMVLMQVLTLIEERGLVAVDELDTDSVNDELRKVYENFEDYHSNVAQQFTYYTNDECVFWITIFENYIDSGSDFYVYSVRVEYY